jgi:hypothetical protein
MECKFINQNNIHERYLLDRLSDREKIEYLSHLNTCESCKDEMKSEKEFLGSVRHFGKDEMKFEIARQVAAIKSKQLDVSWDMILKVAAIFFFLVITPGLVYYYQTLEPSKVSELYDYEEFVGEQKESEKAEPTASEEEAQEKPEMNIKANRERKRVKDIVSSSRIKSTSGAAAEPSIQSVGIAKPVKKSKDIVIEKSSEDAISFEMEHPKPAAPKSSLPELRQYQKPTLVSVQEAEYNRLKVVSNKKISSASRSQEYDKTQTEQYSANGISSVNIAKSEQISLGKLSKNENYKLDYRINNKIVVINLIPLFEKSDFYFQESYPDSFPVIIKHRDMVDLTMDWFVNSQIRNINPNEISLFFEEENSLNVNFLNEKFYKINLKSDSTVARIIH